MKKKSSIVGAVALLLIILCGMILVYFFSPISVNNDTAAHEIITKDYSLEQLFLMEAIFSVRDGFGDISASDLAHEVGVKLECKRQPSATQFYYVVQGDGYRCFIITDEADFVEYVFVTPMFATISETKNNVAKYREISEDFLISENPECYYSKIWRSCGTSYGYFHYLFTLQDGVMIMKKPYELTANEPQYFYYTDDEWFAACDEWNGFIILPIDKQPW